jgi:hypothetical protein
VVFTIVIVVGALAQRRWGIRASVVVVVLAWPIFLGTAVLNELLDLPQLFELNPFGIVFRMLWKSVTVDTVGLAVALWFVSRAVSVRGAVVRGVGSATVWAFVMPVPLAIVEIALMSVIPAGKAEYYYIDLRPMGLEVLETNKPPFRHYTGEAIPLRYRAELDGREIEVQILAVESLSEQLEIRALTPGSPPFTIDRPLFTDADNCVESLVRERDNVIWALWPQRFGCSHGAAAPEAALTFRFAGSPTSLTVRGPIVKAGEYYFYDSL